ncbi:ABC transporter permease [Deinococcus sp. DB0503]|uniref:ABC transporter permease n=1 Tax=Deinococcus sp. DB0503 TaxID=2479203 RepID=UPI0018DF4730|nr:ABC-2 family transporter protein [Deinococcus sp. DB0503]
MQLAIWKQQGIDRFSGVISIILEQLIFLIVILAIGNVTDSINGWTVKEMLLLYGINRICVALADTIGENLWITGELAREGDLIIYKTLPLNPLLILLLNKIHFERLLGAVSGIVIVAYSIIHLQIILNIITFILLTIFIILGFLVLLSIMILGSTLTIHFTGTDQVGLLWNIVEFSKYPTSIFGRSGNILLTYIFPLAITGYLPASFILSNSHGITIINIVLSCIMAILLFLLAVKLWMWSLKTYEGTGS